MVYGPASLDSAFADRFGTLTEKLQRGRLRETWLCAGGIGKLQPRYL
jgi:hypothetical protein